MRKLFVMALAALPALSMAAGVARAKGKPADKGKPAQKKDPVVTYVFKGEIASLDADSVVVSVQEGNKFAKPYAG